MQLLGLSLSQLLAVLGVASALTIGLYLLKLRRHVVAVPFIPLWDQLLSDRRASRLFARLRHVLSLLLALLLVSLLVFAAGDPRRRSGSASARHLVVLIDAGLTMQARDLRPDRLHVAIERARHLVRSAGPDLQMLVAQMDASTTPLSSMSPEPRELEAALSHIATTDLTTDQRRAFDFALDVLRAKSGAEIVVLSDQLLDPDPALAAALTDAGVRVSYEPIGRRSDNVGISAFAVRRFPLDKNQSELLLELYSASPRPRQVELTLLGDGLVIDVQRLTLEPGRTLRRFYDDVTAVSQTLEARISAGPGGDDLATDDRAYAVLPPRHRTRVLCVSQGNRYLEASLLLDEYLDVDLVAPASYVSAAGYDAVIFDHHLPDAAPAVPALYLDPEGDGAKPLLVQGSLQHPVFARIERQHPLLRFTALADVNVASALLVQPAPADEIVAADPRGPLIVAGKRSGTPFVALTFDLQESDLPLRVAWPLLLLNSLDWLTRSDQNRDYESSSIAGQTMVLSLPDGVTAAQVSGPGQRAEFPVRDGRLALSPTRAGFYRVSWPGAERLLAVNLSPDARRDLSPEAPRRAGKTTAPRPELPAPGSSRPPWALLVLAALLLLTAEWATYHRRWTV
jgi:Ca-activated chloride channel family protein